jgi:hypothetical protein
VGDKKWIILHTEGNGWQVRHGLIVSVGGHHIFIWTTLNHPSSSMEVGNSRDNIVFGLEKNALAECRRRNEAIEHASTGVSTNSHQLLALAPGMKLQPYPPEDKSLAVGQIVHVLVPNFVNGTDCWIELKWGYVTERWLNAFGELMINWKLGETNVLFISPKADVFPTELQAKAEIERRQSPRST